MTDNNTEVTLEAYVAARLSRAGWTEAEVAGFWEVDRIKRTIRPHRLTCPDYDVRRERTRMLADILPAGTAFRHVKYAGSHLVVEHPPKRWEHSRLVDHGAGGTVPLDQCLNKNGAFARLSGPLTFILVGEPS